MLDYHFLPLSICPVLPTPSQVQMGGYPAFYRVKTSRPVPITSFIIQILRVLEQEKGGESAFHMHVAFLRTEHGHI